MGPFIYSFTNWLEPAVGVDPWASKQPRNPLPVSRPSFAKKTSISLQPPPSLNATSEARGRGRLSLFDCYWFVYGALLRQGTPLEPMSGTVILLQYGEFLSDNKINSLTLVF